MKTREVDRSSWVHSNPRELESLISEMSLGKVDKLVVYGVGELDLVVSRLQELGTVVSFYRCDRNFYEVSRSIDG